MHLTYMRAAFFSLSFLIHVRTSLATASPEQTTTPQPCDSFAGNPDFYGLGIRLGVYLQLFSSWISNTLNPEVISDNHAANTIFLLAILIAIVQGAATTDQQIKPIEVWIMLQICFAFSLTVLSLFGFRVQFYRPSSIPKLLEAVRGLDWKSLNPGLAKMRVVNIPRTEPRVFLKGIRRLFREILKVSVSRRKATTTSLNTITFIKH